MHQDLSTKCNQVGQTGGARGGSNQATLPTNPKSDKKIGFLTCFEERQMAANFAGTQEEF